jgi:hypothetical protein
MYAFNLNPSSLASPSTSSPQGTSTSPQRNLNANVNSCAPRIQPGATQPGGGAAAYTQRQPCALRVRPEKALTRSEFSAVFEQGGAAAPSSLRAVTRTQHQPYTLRVRPEKALTQGDFPDIAQAFLARRTLSPLESSTPQFNPHAPSRSVPIETTASNQPNWVEWIYSTNDPWKNNPAKEATAHIWLPIEESELTQARQAESKTPRPLRLQRRSDGWFLANIPLQSNPKFSTGINASIDPPQGGSFALLYKNLLTIPISRPENRMNVRQLVQNLRRRQEEDSVSREQEPNRGRQGAVPPLQNRSNVRRGTLRPSDIPLSTVRNNIEQHRPYLLRVPREIPRNMPLEFRTP